LPEIAERGGVALLRGEPKKARGLVIVLRQAAATYREEDPEVVLRRRQSLVCGELEKARRLAIVSRQPATALRMENPEAALRRGVSPLGGEFVCMKGRAFVRHRSFLHSRELAELIADFRNPRNAPETKVHLAMRAWSRDMERRGLR
jgi:hypothetical protein